MAEMLALQADLVELQADLQRRQAALGSVLSEQDLYVPPSLMEVPDAAPEHPEPSTELPIYGAHGYRVWPVNGHWVSLRAPECEYMRAAVKRTYGFTSNEVFYERQVRVDGELKVVDVPV